MFCFISFFKFLIQSSTINSKYKNIDDNTIFMLH